MNWRKIKCYVEKEMDIIGVEREAGKTGAPPPKGLAKEKAQWLKPGLVGRSSSSRVRRSFAMRR